MTIASALTALNTDIVNAREAITTKGGTVTSGGGSSQLATDIATIPTGGGSTGKYQLLDRVKTDSNVAIGTVSGFFTDANNVEYAVVCLDAQYRLASGQWCSKSGTTVTNLPLYNGWGVWEAKETATTNTQLILNYASSQSATSTACSHCRSKSFVIGGTTYYGQLPNIYEVSDILRHYIEINNADTSGSSYNSLRFPQTSGRMWGSNQQTTSNGWHAVFNGALSGGTKNTNYMVTPVLEIPNAL